MELKPCPFCGSSDVSMRITKMDKFTDKDDFMNVTICFVECQECEARTKGFLRSDDGLSNAQHRWNRRC